MGELGFQWGGPLGLVKDHSEVELHPNAFGSAHIDVVDPVAFNGALAEHGGEPGLIEAVKRSIMQSLATVLSSRLSRDSMLGVMRDSAGLIADVESYGNRMLQSTGAGLRIMNLQVTLTEEDMASLQKVQMASAMAMRAAKAITEPTPMVAPVPQGPFPPGTRVIATWSDGKGYPGHVKNFDGRNYELVWEGSASIAWVPAASVRPQ
jgi:hypothetical protein